MQPYENPSHKKRETEEEKEYVRRASQKVIFIVSI